MLKVDPSLNHIPAGREHVIALFESINQPLVNIPSYGTAPTGAFILGTRNEYGYYTVFVYLYQTETRAVVVYVSEPRNLNAEQYRAEEQEGVRFVESMGFMIDNIHFPTLAQSEQEAVMARIPMFRPPDPTMNLYEAVEDPSQTRFPKVASQPGGPPPPPPGPFGQGPSDVFGGLSPQEGDVFRRAGLDAGSPLGAGMPFSNQAGAFSHGMSSPQPMGSPPGPPQMSPSSPPPQPERGPAGGLSPESLERLGRLLGAFCLLLVLTVVGACQSGGTAVSIEQRKRIESHIDLGNQHLIRGQFAEAIQTFDLVLDMDEDNRDALRGKGMAYWRLNRQEEAERFYRRAIQADPTWSEPKNELGEILISTKRCVEAEELLRGVLKDIFYRTPEFAEHNLALALDCQGKTQEAMKLLEGLVLKRPVFCLGYLTLAKLSARSKAPQVTIDACEGFFTNCEQNDEIKEQISPEHGAMCYLKKGLAHVEMGDVESARASFKRCQASGTYGQECRRSLNMLPP